MTTRRVYLAAAAALAALLVALAWIGAGLPPRSEVRALRDRNPGKTRLMLEREEQASARGRRARSSQSWVPISAVSRHLIHAVIAAEDQKFFGHEGVDWEAIQDSVGRNLEKRRFARGGSTITQQLAKNLYFGTAKTPQRKLRELIVTHWLESDLRKARILALYLNVIEWGDGIYGCEAAARRWYGKPAAALNPSEAAGLAAMIPNPRRLNPAVAPARHARATRRVLWLMGMAGYLSRSGLGAEPPAEPVPEDDGEPPVELPVETPPPFDPLAPVLPSPTPPPDEAPPATPAEPQPLPSPTPTPPPSGPDQAVPFGS